MAKKEEKDAKGGKEEKGAKAEKVPLTPEEEAAKGKKKKLIIIAVASLLVVGGGGAGAFLFLGKGTPKPEGPAGEKASESGAHGEGEAEGDPHAKTDKDTGHETKKDDGHGAEKKDDGHGGAKKDDGHGAKKDDGHGAKDDGHGAKKDDGHGAKDDGHGAKDDGHGGAKKDGKDAEPEYKGDFGQIKELKPFHLNLGNPLENRYVRLTIGIEYKGGQDQQLELDRREPQLRDAIVSIVSRKTREHLLSPDGKDQMRLELKNKMNQHLDKKIENVFITDILIE